VIRAARAGDVVAVLGLWSLARSVHASRPDSTQGVERLLSERPGALLVAERDDAIIGTLIAASDGWRGNMYRLAVAPEHRRQGVALALVREGERRLRTDGIVRITALVAHDDDVARGLWATAGYELDSEIGRFVRNL
jgi:ribosomal protein S18 acetylase RimI-like enzyme